MLPVIDHLGNVYSASSTVTLDEQHSNNDATTEINGTIHRPDSITLSKDEPGDPSVLENTWKEEGDCN